MAAAFIIIGCLNLYLPSSSGYFTIGSILFIANGIYHIYLGRSSYRLLSVGENGISIRQKKKQWDARWNQFSIIEDDLVSFVVKIEKEQFRFLRKSLPEEVH
jgi:hypothetical protein